MTTKLAKTPVSSTNMNAQSELDQFLTAALNAKVGDHIMRGNVEFVKGETGLTRLTPVTVAPTKPAISFIKPPKAQVTAAAAPEQLIVRKQKAVKATPAADPETEVINRIASMLGIDAAKLTSAIAGVTNATEISKIATSLPKSDVVLTIERNWTWVKFASQSRYAEVKAQFAEVRNALYADGIYSRFYGDKGKRIKAAHKSQWMFQTADVARLTALFNGIGLSVTYK